MFSEKKPILFSCPPEYDTIELYLIHDVHYGNECFDKRKWKRLKEEILAVPNRYCLIVGDIMENALPTSKGNVFTQFASPQEQKEWAIEQFSDLAERIIAVVPGNHEYNRTTKACGLYPLYDCALFAGIGERYRNSYAVVDIGVGTGGHTPGRQVRYVGYLVHKARDTRMYSTADSIDGIDFMVYGHDHDPKDHPRKKLVYDNKNKYIVEKDIEVVDGGAFLEFGGYAATSGYRPLSSKLYKFILDGKRKCISTVGFYL